MRNYQFIKRDCNGDFTGVTMTLNDVPLGSIIRANGTSTYSCRAFFYSANADYPKWPLREWVELTADDAMNALRYEAEKFLDSVG